MGILLVVVHHIDRDCHGNDGNDIDKNDQPASQAVPIGLKALFHIGIPVARHIPRIELLFQLFNRTYIFVYLFSVSFVILIYNK